MDIVKAVISIGEASVQLEGPQEFVEKYLDQYGSFIEKWQKLPPASGKATEGTKVEKKRGETKRTRISTKSGCSEKIRTLISENYFEGPRTGNDITNYLKDQKSVTFKGNQVSAALSTFIKSGELRRFKEGKVYKYCNV